MDPVKAVLFDLDGTLLDSAPDLLGALNWLRRVEALPAFETSGLSRYVSRGAVGILTAGMPATTEEQFADWKYRFLQRYATRSYDESRLYAGIPELLDRLENIGIPWGIVTNKMEALTLPILEAAGLSDRAGSVVCGDTLEKSKPNPEPVLFACKQLGVAPQFTLFAGDDIRDIQAGVSAGTMTAAVFYGYGSDELRDCNIPATIDIHQPGEFIELIDRQAQSRGSVNS